MLTRKRGWLSRAGRSRPVTGVQHGAPRCATFKWHCDALLWNILRWFVEMVGVVSMANSFRLVMATTAPWGRHVAMGFAAAMTAVFDRDVPQLAAGLKRCLPRVSWRYRVTTAHAASAVVVAGVLAVYCRNAGIESDLGSDALHDAGLLLCLHLVSRYRRPDGHDDALSPSTRRSPGGRLWHTVMLALEPLPGSARREPGLRPRPSAGAPRRGPPPSPSPTEPIPRAHPPSPSPDQWGMDLSVGPGEAHDRRMLRGSWVPFASDQRGKCLDRKQAHASRRGRLT